MRLSSLWIGAVALVLSGASARALSLDLLEQKEIALLESIREKLGPFVEERKKAGTAPLLTFEELYGRLEPEQIAFMDAIRRLDPSRLEGSSRKLPEPEAGMEFVRLEGVSVLKEGRPVPLDVQYLPRPVFEAYRRMMLAMDRDIGRQLLVESGYRSPAYQLYLFVFYLPKHGYSIRETNRHVALPGCSEHGSPGAQAIDFITPEGVNGEEVPEEFEALEEYRWLNARAHEFGFHLSYPRGGPSAFEPWHWHYEEPAVSLDEP